MLVVERGAPAYAEPIAVGGEAKVGSPDLASGQWEELDGTTGRDYRLLAARKARFHRGHRRALVREWAGALPVLVVAAWVATLIASFILLH